jgi:hypothetical protein
VKLNDLKLRADKWFSLMIRLESCDHRGYCKCFVTGESVNVRTIQAGHYIDRRHLQHRYNPINVHPQSADSNVFAEDGDHEAYRAAMIKEYGLRVVEDLENTCPPFKITKAGYEDMIKGYKYQIKEFLREKGIEKWW